MMSIRILTAFALALAVAAAGPTMATGATALTIDLQGDPATLDPGRQYDTNSYDVYRAT